MDTKSYEIRAYAKNRWTTISRFTKRCEAIKEGEHLTGKRSLEGIKVVEENYDEGTKLFTEEIIFSYFRQHGKVAIAKTTSAIARHELKKSSRFELRNPCSVVPSPSDFVPVQCFLKKTFNRSEAWFPVVAILLILGGAIGGLGLYGESDLREHIRIAALAEDEKSGKSDLSEVRKSKLVAYNLPTITMMYGPPNKLRRAEVKLVIELNDEGHIKNIDDHLTNIIANVANELSAAYESAPFERKNLKGLRNSLHNSVQAAVGETPVERVLFEEFFVR